MRRFHKVKIVLTPSGLWDNGLYRESDEIVTFPEKEFARAIVEQFECKGLKGLCTKITIDGKSWIVREEIVS